MPCKISIPDLLFVTMSFPIVRADFTPDSTATDHPVEFGVDVTDHVQIKPERFSVDVMVTESPLGYIPAFSAVQNARTFLKSAMGKLLIVDMGDDGYYTSVVLESFPNSRDTMNGRMFSLKFKEIRVALAISIQIPPGLSSVAGAATEAAESAGAAEEVAGAVSMLKDMKDVAVDLSSTVGAGGDIGKALVRLLHR